MLDVFVRVASFESGVTNFNRRLFDAYAAEVARVDGNADGVIDAIEGDLEDESDDQPNERLYIPATKYNRFAVTREINDGLLAARVAPSQRGETDHRQQHSRCPAEQAVSKGKQNRQQRGIGPAHETRPLRDHQKPSVDRVPRKELWHEQ